MSSASAMAALPIELLEHVLAQRLQEASTAEGVDLMLVCRKWKDVVEPIVYYTLAFDDSDYTALSRAIRDAALCHRHPHPIRHTRELRLTVLCERELSGGDVTALIPILSQAAGPESLSVEGRYALPALTLASRACVRSLRALWVGGMPFRGDSAAVLSYVGLFAELRSLTFSLLAPGDADASWMLDIRPWALPHLDMLVVTVMDRWAPSTMQLLCNCALPRLQVAHMSLGTITPDTAALISQFFVPRALEHLYLHYLDEAQYPSTAPHLHAQSLYIHDTRPALVQHLSASVTELHVQPPGTPFVPHDGLWAMLDRVLGAGSSVRVVRMQSSWFDTVPWRYSVQPGDDRHEQMHRKKLREYGALLCQKGIVLQDEEGRAIADYASVEG